MNESVQIVWQEVLGWTQQYGYHAVVPSLLLDPSGVPWGWVALMLIAEKAGLNIAILLIYGLVVMMVNDIALYALGYWGGRPLVNRLGTRFPKLARALEQAESASTGRGIMAVTFGRFLPFVGRWVGTGAGLANVNFARFLLFDFLGAAITVVAFGLLAHFVGRTLLSYAWFPTAAIGVFVAGCIMSLVFVIWSKLAARRRNRYSEVTE